MSKQATEFANRVLADLNREFSSDADYVEALEELVDQAQTALDAKVAEMDEEDERDSTET